MPPLIGTAAAVGRISPLGWILFGIMFFWQIPHFMAVAWTYRGDYAAVHFPMLPVRDGSGHWVARWAFLTTVLLVLLSSAAVRPRPGRRLVRDRRRRPAPGRGCSGGVVAFLRRTDVRSRRARKLFLASIGYLPLVLAALVLDRTLPILGIATDESSSGTG